MSGDATVVTVRRPCRSPAGEFIYTAVVMTGADQLLSSDKQTVADAEAEFFAKELPWFGPVNGFQAAERYAELLRDDWVANGGLIEHGDQFHELSTPVEDPPPPRVVGYDDYANGAFGGDPDETEREGHWSQER